MHRAPALPRPAAQRFLPSAGQNPSLAEIVDGSAHRTRILCRKQKTGGHAMRSETGRLDLRLIGGAALLQLFALLMLRQLGLLDLEAWWRFWLALL